MTLHTNFVDELLPNYGRSFPYLSLNKDIFLILGKLRQPISDEHFSIFQSATSIFPYLSLNKDKS